MLDKLCSQYKVADKNLSKKAEAICIQEKLTWRRLDKVTENAEKMLEEVDKAIEDQVHFACIYFY